MIADLHTISRKVNHFAKEFPTYWTSTDGDRVGSWLGSERTKFGMQKEYDRSRKVNHFAKEFPTYWTSTDGDRVGSWLGSERTKFGMQKEYDRSTYRLKSAFACSNQFISSFSKAHVDRASFSSSSGCLASSSNSYTTSEPHSFRAH
ncbi:hypothetical protein Tcan_13409 [Toxocara canis]|uniref:Uncharacterized protein n=1 Tax=Toxocara canis TaxID=6265 RepID=A0A0B2VBX2_TOXCA|nr:hypothetical protein Tcan_13409 [Toxocara canis]